MTDRSATAGRLVRLGRIVAAHGIKGDLLIVSDTVPPEALASYGDLTDATGQHRFPITVKRATSKGLIAVMAGVADRSTAEALAGTVLFVARSQLPVPGEETFYHADLVGCAAVDGAGQRIGIVVAVHNFGAGDLMEIAMESSGATEFLPFVTACVPTIDLGRREVTVILQDATDPEEQKKNG